MAVDIVLWYAVIVGPAAVAMSQLAGYALVKPVCASGHPFVLTLISLVALALSLSGAWIGWTRRTERYDTRDFVACVAIWLSLLTSLLIAMQAYPHFVLSPCE
jgi:hypothetical protein